MMEQKKSSNGLKVLVVVLVLILLGAFGFIYYGYNKYNDLKLDNKNLNSKYDKLLTECNNKEANFRLQIKESSWSGWSADYKPKEVTNEYDVELNKKYVIKTGKFSYKKDNKWVEEEREIFSFKVIEINDSSIRIQTYQPFSDNDDNTVNLRSDKKEFIITNKKALKLTTPTMDEGDIFILSLIK